MKFTGSLLALALMSANAFVIQPNVARKTSLASTPAPDFNVGAGVAAPAAGAGGSMQASGKSAPEGKKPSPVIVQGGSLRTWSFTNPNIDSVQVMLKTDGRPLNANVQLWQGPDNTPQEMGVYIEDGNMRPFSAVIATPRDQNAICIRNTGHLEFPLTAACLEGAVTEMPLSNSAPKTVQGGAVSTYPFAHSVESVMVMLQTDGRPLNSRIELLQGPSNNKQVIEVYTEDGLERPFYAVFETPGSGNVVRIVNTATVEFPLTARVEPFLVNEQSQGQMSASTGASSWDQAGNKFSMLNR